MGIPLGRRLQHDLLVVAAGGFRRHGRIGPPGNGPVLGFRGFIGRNMEAFFRGQVIVVRPSAHQLAVFQVFLALDGVHNRIAFPVNRHKIGFRVAGEEIKPVQHKAVEHRGPLQQEGIVKLLFLRGVLQHRLQVSQGFHGFDVPSVFVRQFLPEHEVIAFHIVLVNRDKIVSSIIFGRFPLALVHGGVQRRPGQQVCDIVYRVFRYQVVAAHRSHPGRRPEEVNPLVFQRHPGNLGELAVADVRQGNLHVDLAVDIRVDRVLHLLDLRLIRAGNLKGVTVQTDFHFLRRAGKRTYAQRQDHGQYHR